jgi:hypothetical protein
VAGDYDQRFLAMPVRVRMSRRIARSAPCVVQQAFQRRLGEGLVRCYIDALWRKAAHPPEHRLRMAASGAAADSQVC